MRRTFLAAFGLLVVSALIRIVWLTANETPPQPLSRAAILEQGIRRVAQPAIDRLVATAADLKLAAHELSDSPNADSVRKCQDAWRQVHQAWKNFQPISGACGLDTMPISEISYWPAFASSIENVIKSQRALDPAFFEILGAGAKGIYTLEYLLFDLPSGNTGRLGDEVTPRKPRMSAAKLSDDPSSARRRSYVVGLAEHLADRCETLRRAIGQPELLAQWKARGQDSVNQVVNHFVEILETAAVMRMVRQLELLDQRRLTYEGIEGVAGSASIAAFTALIDGIDQLYRGADGPGLDDELRAINPELAERLNAHFQRARLAFQEIKTPLDEALLKNRALVEQAVAEFRALEVLVKADLASALGVTITFSSTDGD